MNILELLFGPEKAATGPKPPAVLPGRNEPCWCGSQKRYKLCHQQQDNLLQELEHERSRACTSFT